MSGGTKRSGTSRQILLTKILYSFLEPGVSQFDK